MKGDKVVAFCDRRCNVIAPFVVAPGNRNEAPLLREARPEVMRIVLELGMDLCGTIVSLDGVYDCRANRKAILRDYIKATVGFEKLGEATDTPPKSLIRMFGPRGNPQARNLFGIIGYLQQQAGVELHVMAGPRWVGGVGGRDDQKNPHWGTRVDEFLSEEGVREAAKGEAVARVVARQLRQKAEQQDGGE